MCDALRDLVPFVQFKKREKHPWRSVTFSKVLGFACNFTKVTLLHGCLPRFLNCTNSTKWRNATHVMKTFRSVLYMTRTLVCNALQTNVMKDVTCLRHYKVTKCEKLMLSSHKDQSMDLHFKSIMSFLHDGNIVL